MRRARIMLAGLIVSAYASSGCLAGITVLTGGGAMASAPLKVSAPVIARSLMAAGRAAIESGPSESLKILYGVVMAYPNLATQEDPIFQRLADALAPAAKAETPSKPEAPWEELPLDSLQAAALRAEVAANAEADALLGDMPGKLDLTAAGRLESRAARLSADAAYLTGGRRERVATVYEDIKEVKRRHANKLEDWIKLTPGRMAMGDFNGKGLFEHDVERGWVPADAHPEQMGETNVPDAIRERMREVREMPKGPWQAAAYRALARNLIQENIEHLGVYREQTLRDLKWYEEEASASGDPKIKAARKALEPYFSMSHPRYRGPYGSLPKLSHVETMLKHYDHVSGFETSESAVPWRQLAHWRIARTLWKGDEEAGYPALETLLETRRRIAEKAERNMLRYAWAQVASLVGFVLSFIWLPGLSWPALVAMALTLGAGLI